MQKTIQIETFNVRTFNRIGQLPELTASTVEHKSDIVCIQEHRYTHNWQWMDASHCISLEKLDQCHGRRCRHTYRTKSLKSLNSIVRIQPRIMIATINGNPRAAIISCYSPTNVSEETELVAFYDELSSLVRSILKHNMLVNGGHMNAQKIQLTQHVK